MGKSVRIATVCLLSALLAGVSSPVGASDRNDPPPDQLQALMDMFRDSHAQISNTRYVALLNYRQPSREPRFYLIDPEKSVVIGRYIVAHGRGSDPQHTGHAKRFSDREGSRRSSLGFFVTGDTYISESKGHGLSLRLRGLSDSNRNAEARNIVIHANWYMQPKFLKKQGKPGRSHGCLVFSEKDRDEIVEKLKGGALILAAD